ncbi:hypothetical protein WH390_06230 [Candidatus Arsenophonus nilaparvatae]|uniref:hypothetical protein n=2 Tax=Candidatus Arsenophonus nilaparvatae TaxID=1247023 RepID=UPI003877ABCA
MQAWQALSGFYVWYVVRNKERGKLMPLYIDADNRILFSVFFVGAVMCLGSHTRVGLIYFFYFAVLSVFYPVLVSASSIAVNHSLSNKYPFYAYENSQYYEGHDRRSIALRAFEDEKVKKAGVVYCMPSRSCKFKKITSISDVGIFNNVRVDYVGTIIGGLGDTLEGAGFYTVSVRENDNFDKSKSDDAIEKSTPEEICKKKPPLSGSQSGVRSISGERYIYVDGCEYIATGDVLICFDKSDICNATSWKPTGEVAEGKGYGKTNNNDETTLAHSFCASQYGTYGSIGSSDEFVVTDRCKPVFKEDKFLGWVGSGAYSDMNNPPDFPDTGIFSVVPNPDYAISDSASAKDKVEYNLNYLALHPDLDLARYPLPVYSDLPLSSPSGSGSINLGSTAHSVDAGSSIAGSLVNTESATHSLSSSGTSQSGVSSSSGASSNFGQSSGSKGNGQGTDLSHPDNNEPDLDSPTAESVLSPLQNLFPFLKNFNLPERAASCPVATFEVFEQHFVIDAHCTLFESIRGLLTLFSMIIWSFLGLRIVLSS